VLEGVNFTADSFYSSQGRLDDSFADHNATLLDDLVRAQPQATSLEMETFQLFHLARLCRPPGAIRASAAGARPTPPALLRIRAARVTLPFPCPPPLPTAIIFANRRTNMFIDPLLAKERERAAGHAVLETLAATPLS
jgi:uridine phosphorylase